MGGIRSFFLESKHFQLVLEEGGRYFKLQIFERGKFFMRSVFLGKNAAHWLMLNIEHIVVGVSPKQFFTLREGDTAFTLQWSSNSFGQFLLLTELKTGGSRRSIIIPEGKERYGWRAFGLELRKVLNPSHYAVGENGPKFIPQVWRFNLEAHSRTFAEVVQGFHGRVEDRKKPMQPGVSVKGKIPHKGEKKMGEILRITGAKVGDFPVKLSDKMEGVGGVRRESCILEEAEGGEQTLADPRISVPSSSLNSKVYDRRKKSDVWSAGWSRRGLVVEVDVIGRRRVFWERKRGGGTKSRIVSRAVGRESVTDASNSLKWVPKGFKRAAVKPYLGLGTSPELADPGVGFIKPVFSGPSTFEVGEGSLAGGGGSAQALLMDVSEFGVPAWRDEHLVDGSSLAGSSGELVVSCSTGGPPSPPEAVSSSLAGSSDELSLVLGKAGDAGTSSDEPPFSPGRSDELSSVGSNSGELTVSPGKAEMAISRPLVECFLSGLFLSFLRAGLVVLGDQERDDGGLVSLTPIAALEPEQPRLVELPTKILCAVPEASGLVEEGWNLSDKGLGGEDSSPVPLLSITPSGNHLSAELNCGNEAVGCVNILDTSRWVKNRLPGFSKLVGLPLNRHEKLCIALLQKIEKEMEIAKAVNRNVTLSRKVVIFKDKGKRELRNLQSSVNYDSR